MKKQVSGQDFLELCSRLRADRKKRHQRELATQPMAYVPEVSLPASWTWASVSELCERVSVGHVGQTTEYFTELPEGITFVRSQNVRPGCLELGNCAKITPEFNAKLKKSQLQKGDVLIVRVGANRGDVASVKRDCGAMNCANIVFARPLVDTGFLAFFLQSPQGRDGLLALTTGAAQGVINTGSVAGLPTPVPPLPTQRRIASILSSYDDLIENNTRRIEILEEMARRIYEEWFVHFRFPGHEDAKFVETEQGRIPEGWKRGKLEDVVVLQRGFDLPKKLRQDGEFLVVSATGASGTHIECKVKAPGVVTGRSGSLGTVSYITQDYWPLNTTLWGKAYPLGSVALAFFVLNSIDLKGFNSGAAVPTLNRNDIHGLPMPIPPSGLVEQFDEYATQLFKLRQNLINKNGNLRVQRDLLLPKLVSGQIDVSDAENMLEDVA